MGRNLKSPAKPPRRPDHDAMVALIGVHEQGRRERIEAAWAAMRYLPADDAAMVLRWVKAGAMNEAELGRAMADYRRALGESYGTAGVE